jgi:hypothetical protein
MVLHLGKLERSMDPPDVDEAQDTVTCLACGKDTLCLFDLGDEDPIYDGMGSDGVWWVHMPPALKYPPYCPHCDAASDGEEAGRWE